MKRLLMCILMALAMTGCNMTGLSEDSALKDGYQLGDLTREAVRLQAKWCDESDPFAKLALLKILERAKILPEGTDVCEVDIVEWLAGK